MTRDTETDLRHPWLRHPSDPGKRKPVLTSGWTGAKRRGTRGWRLSADTSSATGSCLFHRTEWGVGLVATPFSPQVSVARGLGQAWTTEFQAGHQAAAAEPPHQHFEYLPRPGWYQQRLPSPTAPAWGTTCARLRIPRPANPQDLGGFLSIPRTPEAWPAGFIPASTGTRFLQQRLFCQTSAQGQHQRPRRPGHGARPKVGRTSVLDQFRLGFWVMGYSRGFSRKRRPGILHPCGTGPASGWGHRIRAPTPQRPRRKPSPGHQELPGQDSQTSNIKTAGDPHLVDTCCCSSALGYRLACLALSLWLPGRLGLLLSHRHLAFALLDGAGPG